MIKYYNNAQINYLYIHNLYLLSLELACDISWHYNVTFIFTANL